MIGSRNGGATANPVSKNRFNFDKIEAKVVKNNDIEFELFKKGKFDVFGVSDGNRWVKQTDFEEIEKGYIHKQLIYQDVSAGIRGIMINTTDPMMKDPILRRALAHCLDFKTINQKFLFGLEQRQTNFFDTYPPYKKPGMKPWPFDLKEADRLLDEAGWGGPRNAEGIRQKDGRPLKITVSIGNDAWIKYLSFMKETALKAGILLDIKVLDGAALFKSFNERSYQAIILVYTSGQFPAPRQYLHSENVQKGTNNLFMFGNEELDRLIETYEYDMDEKKRIEAVYRIEDIVKENTLLIPFWRRDHTKLLWWRYIKGPQGFITPSGFDLSVLWYDQKEAERLGEYQDKGKSFKRLPEKSDPFGVKKK